MQSGFGAPLARAGETANKASLGRVVFHGALARKVFLHYLAAAKQACAPPVPSS